ncbi:MAG: hypothetical protein FJ271_04630 [Planctomycetes bacterium]|nr:hypothetical protein [Planctomycetota bacterium]
MNTLKERNQKAQAKVSTLDVARLFDTGNYALVAQQGDREDWRTYAALGLVGKAGEALAGLAKFAGPLPEFYSAVAHWIDGNDAAAVAGLDKIPLPHAQRLLALLKKPQINVLAQWPWNRSSCSDLLSGAASDPRFRVSNIGFDPADLPNEPYADIHRYYDPNSPPDFYSSFMIEWQLMPPNLQELPCPIFGQTGDYDLHIQAVLPWLKLFDEVLVTDTTEWEDVCRLVDSPVSTFPKSFGLPQGLPPIPRKPRKLDVFLSGTLLHAYHPDKARLLLQVLQAQGLNLRLYNGFLDARAYFKVLGNAKVSIAYVRHAHAMPTRGMEALAMGCALMVQEGSVLTLFAGETEGVHTYSLEANTLGDEIVRVLADWPEQQRRALRGAEVLRREFDLSRVSSQYLRFLTYLAARPRSERKHRDAKTLRQKRCILEKGWLPSWDFKHSRLLKHLGDSNYERFRADLRSESACSHAFIDAAREAVLANYHRASHRLIPVSRWLDAIVEIYQEGMARFPRSLVLRFNAARTMLHFGGTARVSEGLQLIDDILAQPEQHWEIDVLEDVFPWDFFSQFFNYRTYFDMLNRQLMTGEPVEALLRDLILASLHYYRGRHRPFAGLHTSGLDDLRQATRLDPEFPYYALHCAEQLAARNHPGDIVQALRLLLDLGDSSILFREAAALAEEILQTPPGVCLRIDAARRTQKGHAAAELLDHVAGLARVRDRFQQVAEFQEDVSSPLVNPACPDEEVLLASQIQLLKNQILAMESSKFWKARQLWTFVKRRLKSLAGKA